jgi:YVTN family beta-propeller protein
MFAKGKSTMFTPVPLSYSTSRRYLLALVVICAVLLSCATAFGQVLIGSVPVQNDAFYLVANGATNTLYVVNSCGTDPACGSGSPSTITVVNGATNTVITTVTVGHNAQFATINAVTNKIYVSNRRDNTVSVINGATNTVIKTISVGSHPTVEDVDPITNKIYVVNNGNGQGTTMSVIDGNTDTVVATVTVGNYPVSVAVDPVRNKIYVENYCGAQFGCNATPAPGTVSVIDGTNNTVTHTVTVGYGPLVLLVNNVTNKIYTSNSCGTTANCVISGDDTNVIGTVTQIDGDSFATQTATTGQGQAAMTVNSVANTIYVSNSTDNTESVINGSTLAVATVNVGTTPFDVEVDTARNIAYVCNYGSNNVTAIDGATLTTHTVAVGNMPVEAWVNQVVDRVYVSNVGDNTVSVLSGVPPSAIQFVSLTPCRLVDTRGTHDPILGGTSQNYVLPGANNCGIPTNAVAVSLNVTVLPTGPLGYLTIWPTGQPQPVVSTMNSRDGRNKANAAILPVGFDGAVSVFVTNTSNVILDTNGYFVAPGGGSLQFYTVTPCRIVDTRNNQDGGTLQAGVERDYNIPPNCGIPTTASAYSLNVSVIPPSGGLDYLTVWPKGEPQPTVSTLNDPTGTIVANAAIVPAGAQNATAFYAHNNNTDLLVDVNGYFAPPGTGGLSLYPTVPCRVLDTRNGSGAFMGQITVGVASSPCALPNNAEGYVFNATVIPSGRLGFLTLWPHGQTQPTVSTLNALDGFVTSNAAIVPTSDGSIDAYAPAPTQLILDLSGYFAP